MKINHTGVVVGNIDESVEIFKALGYEAVSDKIEDRVQYNYLQFIKNSTSGEVIELIQAMDESSLVYRSKGLHHLCYEVGNIDAFIADFRQKKTGIIFTKKLNAPAFDYRTIVFAYLRNGTVVEFLESD